MMVKLEKITKSIGSKEHRTIYEFFDKTPESIICPHFWMLKFGYGCNFNCSYCYLRGTLHGQMNPWFRTEKEILDSTNDFFEKMKNQVLVNSGEITDSLVNIPLMEKIVDRYEEQNKHKILLLTKGSNVDFLTKKPRKQTIVSFSLNAPSVSKKWELNSPSPLERVNAGKKVFDEGYEVRVRIDPIFPINGWRKDYSEFVDKLLSKFQPTRITLGTPRGLQKTRIFSKDRSWWKCAFEDNPSEDTGWGKKIELSLRKEIYQLIIDKTKETGYKGYISMCKETPELWNELNMDYKKCKCNCVI